MNATKFCYRSKSRIFLFVIAIILYTFTFTLTNGIGYMLYADPIIAGHTIVAKYDSIPQAYIDTVKMMLVDIPGESHSSGYRIGCQLLEDMDSRFQVNIDIEGAPELYTDQYMRLTNATWGDIDHASGWIHGYGEEDWYTSDTAVQRTKNHLTYCNTNSYNIAAVGFGWCWDMTWHNSPGGGIDPTYWVRYAGSSVGGPDGDLRWGLDEGDSILTGNRVCMQTYIDATAGFVTHCSNNGYPTKVFFTTGPVDGGGNTGESGYQRALKHNYIHNYIATTDSGVLFDYADILCWSNGNEQNTETWTDYGGTLQTFPFIHDDNMLDLDGTYTEDGDHIGQRGALRLAKALWWMLARIAGWDGNPTGIEKDMTSETPTRSSAGMISVYPNPAINSSPLIRVILPCDMSGEIVIFDARGRKVHDVKLNRFGLTGTLKSGNKMCYDYLWESHQAAGVYFAEVRYHVPGTGIIRAQNKIVICR